MKETYIQIRINLTNADRLELVAVSAADLSVFTNWLRDLDTVESVELRVRGGLVWSVI